MTLDFTSPAPLGTISGPGITIFPNPIIDVLTIESEIEILQIELTNLSGQIIKKVDANVLETNLGSLNKGLYVLHIHSADGNMLSFKILKD